MIAASWDWDYVWDILPDLLEGLVTTVEITVIGAAIAMALGMLIAVIRHSKVPVLSQLGTFYIHFIRGTPLLVQLYFAYYVGPKYGLRFSALTTGIVVIGINYSAYTAEVYRSGIEGVARGQWEAALSLSLSAWQRWRLVILPQAVRAVVPALGNYVIALFKDSAILSAITVSELLRKANDAGASDYRYLEAFTLVGVLYFAVSFPAARLIRRLEVRLAPAN